MQITEIDYEVDGQRMVGQFAIDEYRSGSRPAVLLCHEGPGLDDHVRGRAIRLASLGYATFALDYQGEGKALPLDQAMARLGVFMGDAELTRRLGHAGLDVLLAQDRVDPGRVAAIGYCFGGTLALELARDGADLKAVVGFHAGLSSPAPSDGRPIAASVLVCIGADDPVVPIEQRQAFEAEMNGRNVSDWRLHVYGGVGHSFTNPRMDELGMPGFAYNAAADHRSWRDLVDLLEETLVPGD